MGMQMDSEGIITTQTAALAFFPLRTYKDFLFCLTLTSTHQTAVTSGDCRGLGLEVNRSIVFPLEHIFLPMSWRIKGVCWETRFFFSNVPGRRWRGGKQHVYLLTKLSRSVSAQLGMGAAWRVVVKLFFKKMFIIIFCSLFNINLRNSQ